MTAAVMSCDEPEGAGSQMSVSSGGKTLSDANKALHRGTGATATGFTTPPREISAGASRPTLHLAGSRSPPRPRTAEGPSSNVSQNAALVSAHGAPAALPVVGRSNATEPRMKHTRTADTQANGYLGCT